MKLNHLFKTDQLKPPAASPPPSPQMHSFPTPCIPTRTTLSTRSQSTLLITVKEACSRWGRGPGPGLTPCNCASVSQVQETWGPDPWLRVDWTGPAVFRWNTATTPVMPCRSVTVGTVGCPLSGMHQSVTPPVPSLHFVLFAAWWLTLRKPLLLLLLLLCTDLPACVVAAAVYIGWLPNWGVKRVNLEIKQQSWSSVFIVRNTAGVVSSENTDLWEFYYALAAKHFNVAGVSEKYFNISKLSVNQEERVKQ